MRGAQQTQVDLNEPGFFHDSSREAPVCVCLCTSGYINSDVVRVLWQIGNRKDVASLPLRWCKRCWMFKSCRLQVWVSPVADLWSVRGTLQEGHLTCAWARVCPEEALISISKLLWWYLVMDSPLCSNDLSNALYPCPFHSHSSDNVVANQPWRYSDLNRRNYELVHMIMKLRESQAEWNHSK